MATDLLPTGYADFLTDLKGRIRAAQVRAALAVNSELVLLCWQIGRGILERQEREGWGTKILDRLSTDLRHEFPELKGFSPRNLTYMRAFAQAWPDESFVQQVAAQIPWFHNCILIDKLKDPVERAWYAHAAIAPTRKYGVAGVIHANGSRLRIPDPALANNRLFGAASLVVPSSVDFCFDVLAHL